MPLSKRNLRDLESADLKRELKINRARDILVFVPFLMGGFFLTPFVDLPGIDHDILGIPSKYLVIFAIWVLTIFVVAIVNYRFRKYVAERPR